MTKENHRIYAHRIVWQKHWVERYCRTPLVPEALLIDDAALPCLHKPWSGCVLNNYWYLTAPNELCIEQPRSGWTEERRSQAFTLSEQEVITAVCHIGAISPEMAMGVARMAMKQMNCPQCSHALKEHLETPLILQLEAEKPPDHAWLKCVRGCGCPYFCGDIPLTDCYVLDWFHSAEGLSELGKYASQNNLQSILAELHRPNPGGLCCALGHRQNA